MFLGRVELCLKYETSIKMTCHANEIELFLSLEKMLSQFSALPVIFAGKILEFFSSTKYFLFILFAFQNDKQSYMTKKILNHELWEGPYSQNYLESD